MSLVVLNLFLFDEVKEILKEEEYLTEARFSAVKISVEGNVIPLQLINEHMESSLERVQTGKQIMTEVPEMVYLEEFDIFYTADFEDGWGTLGIGADFDISGTAGEQAVLFAMRDIFKGIIVQRQDVTWMYYVSPANGLVFSSPPFPTVSSDNLESLNERQYIVDSLPANNPSRKIVISDPYEDFGGMGFVVTMANAVTVGGVFNGVVCMDIMVTDLVATLSLGRSLGVSSIIDEKRKVISSQEDLIIGSEYGEESGGDSLFGAFRLSGRNYVIEKPVLGGELFFAHRVSMPDVWYMALFRQIPLILILVILNLLILLVVRLRNSYRVAATERDFSRRLLFIVGHDLQTPLSVTSQAVEVISSSKKWEALDLVRRSNQSALNLLKDLSFWGKSRLGEIDIQPAPCPVSLVFGKVVETQRLSAELKNIRIESESTVSLVMADSDALSAVLRNLVSNAVKFSRPDNVVRMEVTPGPAGFAVFRVIDDGDGMDEEQIRKIMDRKPMVSHSGTRGEKGSGIGLSLVTSLCDQAGWPLSVDSEHDKGTTFVFSVPVE